MKSAPTIAFDYRPSRRIAGAVVLMVLAAAATPWMSALPTGAALLVSMLVCVLGASEVRAFLRPPFERIALRDSGWCLVDRGGAEHEAVLDAHARLGPLVSLGLRHGPAAHFRVVVGPDNLDAPTRRRLILLLSRAEIAQKP